MLSPLKPREVLAVPRWVRFSSRLPALGALTRTTVYSYAATLLHAWARPLFLYAAIAACCSVLYAALSIRNLCYSMSEAMLAAAKINLSIVRTVFRFVFVRGWKPRFPHWTLQLEVLVDALRLVTQQYGGRISEPWAARAMRSRSLKLGKLEGYLACYLAGGISLESLKIRDLEHIWLKSTRRTAASRRRVVLFFHGGGFASASPHSYISAGIRIMAAIRSQLERMDNEAVAVDLLLANYRKAPEHPFPAAPNDAFAMYRFLLDYEGLDPSQIVIAGDSAGASLALLTLTTIRDLTPDAQPLAGVLICPFLDLDPTHVLENHEAPHCVLSKEAALGNLRGYASGGLTPQCDHHGLDLHELPPMFVQAATLDLLYDQATRLVARGRQQSPGEDKWQLDEHVNMPHDFTMFPTWLVPYSKVAVSRLASFIAQHATSTPKPTRVRYHE